MSGSLSKRQQARNERALQDLIRSVAGNNTCADCQARNPGWASWSLGIFLCMRCAALHRKLGTHITKVKSLSMDSWTNEQVENMKRVGNIASNRIYNPTNAKPPIPFDADEADSAMERFIRQKYMSKVAQAPVRHNTGSTNSDDQPPPLPPKTGSRFGFRSASSIFPMSSKSRKEAARQEFETSRVRSPSPKMNKQSRVFGAAVGEEGLEDLESKLERLRDMGFTDEKRNTAVLKGLSGNLEKSIETLVRLGEGTFVGGVRSVEISAPPPVSRSRSPLSPAAGLTFNRTRDQPSPKTSSNPFDMLDTPPPIAQPQSSQSTGSLQSPGLSSNPYQQNQNTNPFGLAPSQSQYNLNQAFQNMSVTASQPLFPNHTGGIPGPQLSQQQQLYQQSMTPPVPSIPQQHYQPVIYENTAQPVASYNPFMQQSQKPQPPQAPPITTSFSSNPYNQQLATPQSLYQSPAEQSPRQHYPPTIYENGGQQQAQPQMNPFFNPNQNQNQNAFQQQSNPFLNQVNPQQQMGQQQMAQQQMVQPQQMGQQQMGQQQMGQQQMVQQMGQQIGQQPYGFPQEQYRQQTYPLVSQPTGKADKRSILNLYNYPQLAPNAMQQQLDPNQQQMQPMSPTSMQQGQSLQTQPENQAPGSKNPFALAGGNPVHSPGEDTVGNLVQFAPAQSDTRHISRESMSINDAGAWSNGRHSPDAWGSISARSMR